MLTGIIINKSSYLFEISEQTNHCRFLHAFEKKKKTYSYFHYSHFNLTEPDTESFENLKCKIKRELKPVQSFHIIFFFKCATQSVLRLECHFSKTIDSRQLYNGYAQFLLFLLCILLLEDDAHFKQNTNEIILK